MRDVCRPEKESDIDSDRKGWLTRRLPVSFCLAKDKSVFLIRMPQLILVSIGLILLPVGLADTDWLIIGFNAVLATQYFAGKKKKKRKKNDYQRDKKKTKMYHRLNMNAFIAFIRSTTVEVVGSFGKTIAFM